MKINNFTGGIYFRESWLGWMRDHIHNSHRFSADYTFESPYYRDNPDMAGNDIVLGHATIGDKWLMGFAGDDCLYGFGGNDYLYGDRGNDFLHGGDQNDVLDGGEGLDYLFGENGDDFFVSSPGNDRLFGGTGNDTYNVYHECLIFEDPGPCGGIDTVYAGIDYVLPAIIEKLILVDGAIKGVGNNQDNTLTGNSENNHLDGYSGDDNIMGGDGNDVIQGGDGNDYIWGEKASDLIFGDAGNDNINCGSGNDKAYGGDGNDRLFGEEGDDCLNGGRGNDYIDGSMGNDEISGWEGDDRIIQGKGSDLVWAGEGNDVVIMNDWYPKFVTGDTDILSGGEGNDTFQFERFTGDRSVITDFQTGVDRIALSDGCDWFWDKSIKGLEFTNGVLVEDCFHFGRAIGPRESGIYFDRESGELFYKSTDHPLESELICIITGVVSASDIVMA